MCRLAGGLGWLGILTFGVVSEQLKTRREVAEEERGMRDVEVVKQVTKPNGLKYSDLKVSCACGDAAMHTIPAGLCPPTLPCLCYGCLVIAFITIVVILL